jgi:hypothetical protein
MGQREARLSRDIRKALQLAFGDDLFIFKVWGNEYQMAGLPDLLGCVRGLYFGIETKLPESRENVSPRQALVHDKIRKSGGGIAVCCTRTEAVKFVEGLLSE